MYKRTKNFSCALLMLILLMNFSSVFHTVFHISIVPENFCIAQHDDTAAPHFETSTTPIAGGEDCAVCQHQLRGDCTDIIDNDFLLSDSNNITKSPYIEYFIYSNTFYSSCRAPPAV